MSVTKQILSAWENLNETELGPLARPANEIMSLVENTNLGCNLLMAGPTSDPFVDSCWRNSETQWCVLSPAEGLIKRCAICRQYSQVANLTHQNVYSSRETRPLVYWQAC